MFNEANCQRKKQMVLPKFVSTVLMISFFSNASVQVDNEVDSQLTLWDNTFSLARLISSACFFPAKRLIRDLSAWNGFQVMNINLGCSFYNWTFHEKWSRTTIFSSNIQEKSPTNITIIVDPYLKNGSFTRSEDWKYKPWRLYSPEHNRGLRKCSSSKLGVETLIPQVKCSASYRFMKRSSFNF